MKQLESELAPIWENGRYSPCIIGSGRHFTLPGTVRPVSVSFVEGRFLFNIASLLNVQTGFEIGTAFGYSSFWLAGAITQTWGTKGWFCSLDSQSEGCFSDFGVKFAQEWASRLGLADTIIYKKGWSPDDVPASVGSKQLDIVFIDGSHNEEQPMIDFCAVEPFLSQNAVIIWHDVHPTYGVLEAVSHASSKGFLFRVFNTSCRIGLSFKDEEVFTLSERALNMALREELIPPTMPTEII